MAQIESPKQDPVYPEVRTFVTAHNSDLTEGRGSTVFAKYFDDVHEAVAAAKGIDVQGSDGDVYEILTIWPDKKKRVWGRYYVGKGIGNSNVGFLPGTEWYDPQVDAEIIRRSKGYAEYLELKAEFGQYDPDLTPASK